MARFGSGTPWTGDWEEYAPDEVEIGGTVYRRADLPTVVPIVMPPVTPVAPWAVAEPDDKINIDWPQNGVFKPPTVEVNGRRYRRVT